MVIGLLNIMEVLMSIETLQEILIECYSKALCYPKVRN